MTAGYKNVTSHDECFVFATGRRRSNARKWLRILGAILLALLGLLVFSLGIVHIIIVTIGRVNILTSIPSHQPYLPAWGIASPDSRVVSMDRLEATRDVVPIPCHSHNDYWRRTPLFDAIHAGCISVEADTWLIDSETELYVGHDRKSLSATRTLRSLYSDPLVDLLDTLNSGNGSRNTTTSGVFETNPEQTLVLLVDFKTDGHRQYSQVQTQLEPLRRRNYLSFWQDGAFNSRAITVVASGKAPYDLIAAESGKREIFYDAPLPELRTGDWNSSTSYYASTSFKASIGAPRTGRISHAQLEKIHEQVRDAKERGLKARYWDTPSWPVSLRNHIWQVLVKEGADILNVDDLYAAAYSDWNKVVHGWFDG